jgi:hypothetical protein
MRTVVLKVVAQGDELLKIVWGEGGDTPLCFDPYFVFREQLKATVKDCRDTLEDLVAAFLDRDPAQYAPVLRRLAARGASLYYLLFSGCAQNPDTARAVESWLSNIEDPVRLIVSSDASIHVPWGVVFAGEDDNIASGSAKIDDFRNFWALKYRLTVLYSGMAPKALGRPRERLNFRTLSILNQDAFQVALRSLSGTEQRALNRFLELPEGRADNSDSCRKKWALMVDNDCLLSVFAHATGDAIELSDVDRINVVELRRRFFDPRRRARTRVPECLIVLNGCNTAVGRLDNSFLTATAEAGCCGFVGSEASVPTDFAIKFGLALLHLLLHSGSSVLDAVDQLRRQHWPLGLLYGCYSHPDFRVESNPEPTLPPFASTTNFSYFDETAQ